MMRKIQITLVLEGEECEAYEGVTDDLVVDDYIRDRMPETKNAWVELKHPQSNGE
jgi:hypothetical protein